MLYRKNFYIVADSAEGDTELLSFDNVLRKIHLCDFNLVKISSILPPNSKKRDEIHLKKGSFLYIAYGTLTSNKAKETISASIGIAFPMNRKEIGLIMEHADFCDKIHSENLVESMLQTGMRERNIPIKNICLKSVEHKIQKIASVFCGVAIW